MVQRLTKKTKHFLLVWLAAVPFVSMGISAAMLQRSISQAPHEMRTETTGGLGIGVAYADAPYDSYNYNWNSGSIWDSGSGDGGGGCDSGDGGGDCGF